MFSSTPAFFTKSWSVNYLNKTSKVAGFKSVIDFVKDFTRDVLWKMMVYGWMPSLFLFGIPSMIIKQDIYGTAWGYYNWTVFGLILLFNGVYVLFPSKFMSNAQMILETPINWRDKRRKCMIVVDNHSIVKIWLPYYVTFKLKFVGECKDKVKFVKYIHEATKDNDLLRITFKEKTRGIVHFYYTGEKMTKVDRYE